jgi:hypothetical protein
VPCAATRYQILLLQQEERFSLSHWDTGPKRGNADSYLVHGGAYAEKESTVGRSLVHNFLKGETKIKQKNLGISVDS